MARIQTGTRYVASLIDDVAPVDPVAVASTFSAPAVTMVFGSNSLLGPFILCRSLGTSSLSTEGPGAPLPTSVVSLSALGFAPLPSVHQSQ